MVGAGKADFNRIVHFENFLSWFRKEDKEIEKASTGNDASKGRRQKLISSRARALKNVDVVNDGRDEGGGVLALLFSSPPFALSLFLSHTHTPYHTHAHTHAHFSLTHSTLSSPFDWWRFSIILTFQMFLRLINEMETKIIWVSISAKKLISFLFAQIVIFWWKNLY